MKVETLIQKLKELQSDYGNIDVTVGYADDPCNDVEGISACKGGIMRDKLVANLEIEGEVISTRSLQKPL